MKERAREFVGMWAKKNGWDEGWPLANPMLDLISAERMAAEFGRLVRNEAYETAASACEDSANFTGYYASYGNDALTNAAEKIRSWKR